MSHLSSRDQAMYTNCNPQSRISPSLAYVQNNHHVCVCVCVPTLSDIVMHILFAVSGTMLSRLEIKRACSTSLIKIFNKHTANDIKQCFFFGFLKPMNPKSQKPEAGSLSPVWNHERLKTRWTYHLSTTVNWLLSSDLNLWKRVFELG